MESAELSRARALAEWAPCAPAWVAERLTTLLDRPQLLREDRARILAMLTGLVLPSPPRWACRFPAVPVRGGARAPGGGILVVVAPERDSPPPHGALLAAEAMDLSGVPDSSCDRLFLTGMPRGARGLDGASGSAAAWLAGWARETARALPPLVVVSADLSPGPNGEPRLAEVAHGDEKAEAVARELPDATLYLCGPHAPRPHVVAVAAGTPIRELLRQIFGRSAVVDRAEVVSVAGAAGESFRAHDYRRADARYREVLEIARAEDRGLRHEACLRLGQIAVHFGRPGEADDWLELADGVTLDEGDQGRSAVELLTSQAGAAIDTFRPALARSVLERRPVRHALEPEHHILWERIQALGAWRRVYLIEGRDPEARAIQHALLPLVGEKELPRTLLDLAWVDLRCGYFEAARESLLRARGLTPGMEEVYRAQTLAFLTWYTGRLEIRWGVTGGLDGLADLLDGDAVGALIEAPALQPAGRWRLEALRGARARDVRALEELAERSAPFQRWHLATFLLEVSALRGVGLRLLREAEVDLSGMPELDEGRERLRRGEACEETVFMRFVAY